MDELARTCVGGTNKVSADFEVKSFFYGFFCVLLNAII